VLPQIPVQNGILKFPNTSLNLPGQHLFKPRFPHAKIILHVFIRIFQLQKKTGGGKKDDEILALMIKVTSSPEIGRFKMRKFS